MDTTMRVSGERRVLLACAFVGLIPMGAAADETLLCRTYISAVPYTITRPGHYCLAGNLSTAMTTGAAISIRSRSPTVRSALPSGPPTSPEPGP